MNTLFLSLIVLGIIIFVHEFGHFIFAKLSGIRVEEFSLGMGPPLISKKRGETLYSLRILPLGGYCKMSGETGDGQYNPQSEDPKRFDKKPPLVRLLVLVGGPLMNFLLAILIFSLIFAIIGMPMEVTTEVGSVIRGGPAEKAGIEEGDVIVSIDNQKVESWQDMVGIIHQSSDKPLQLTIKRDGSFSTILVTPQYSPEHKVGLIGIEPTEVKSRNIGFFEAIKEGFLRTFLITKLTILSIIQMITGKASLSEVTGPVGIVKMIGESARFGIVYLANLTALISVSLGLFNLLPVPALDGGRIIFVFFELLTGRAVNPVKENMIHLIGFALLITLMLFVTYRDILRWAS